MRQAAGCSGQPNPAVRSNEADLLAHFLLIDNSTPRPSSPSMVGLFLLSDPYLHERKPLRQTSDTVYANGADDSCEVF